MADSSCFRLASLLALLLVVESQDSVHAALESPRWQAIKPSRMSAYVTRVSPNNKSRIVVTTPVSVVPTVTRTAIELHTVTIIKTEVATVVETTIINAMRETSIFIPVTIRVTATPDISTVYVHQNCTGSKPEVKPKEVGHPEGHKEKEHVTEMVSELMKPANETVPVVEEDEEEDDEEYEEEGAQHDDSVTGAEVPPVAPQEDTLASLVEYLGEFHEVVGHLSVPRNRRKLLLSFVKYTSEESLEGVTSEQVKAIKALLKTLCEEGEVAGEHPEPFFEKLERFVAFMKDSMKKNF